MIGIYKIENLINHKIYVGQSIHIERRWIEHCSPSRKSIISNAIRKYGKENFSFTILEECDIDELLEKEEFYIKKYNSIVPFGYNVKERDNESGRELCYLLDKVVLSEIIDKLKNTNELFSNIADEYGVSLRTIVRINQGQTYFNKEINYPIRKKPKQILKYCIDCGKLIDPRAERCRSCFDIYQRRVNRPTKEELFSFLTKNKGNFKAAGKEYGVSDNAVRKWCKRYEIPSHSSDYK